MEKTFGKLTVFFEDPFWVGIFERQADGLLSVCKITFGAEPRDGEVYGFVLQHYAHLKFSSGLENYACEKKYNPKRRQREARKLTESGIGTKAQQALQLQREQGKAERDAARRVRKQEEKQRQFAVRQQKKKEKHKGR